MSRRIVIKAEEVAFIEPVGAAGFRHLKIELNMNQDQRRELVSNIFAQQTDAEVRLWIQADFPELFEESKE